MRPLALFVAIASGVAGTLAEQSSSFPHPFAALGAPYKQYQQHAFNTKRSKKNKFGIACITHQR
jgi:hypothetical protein